MIKLFFVILYHVFFYGYQQSPVFVTEFHEAITRDREIKYINKYKNSNDVNVKGYVLSLEMKQSKHELMPWNKLKMFNKYKNSLEDLIIKYPNNIHLRYVRLVIQEKIPSLLNYHSNIEEDKIFLKKLLDIKDNTDYLDYYILKNTSL